MTSENTQGTDQVPSAPTKGGPIITPRDYPPPPYLKGLGLPDSVRTPLGHYRTESLFLECWRPIEGQRPAYTLQRESREDPRVPGRMIPSFQAAYLETMDPTGYTAAISLLGSWKHWVKLTEAPWFAKELGEWNAEVVAALRARGLQTYLAQAKDGDLKAADWLSNYTHEGPAPKTKRGRPTNLQVKQAANEQAAAQRAELEDAARIGLGTAPNV